MLYTSGCSHPFIHEWNKPYLLLDLTYQLEGWKAELASSTTTVSRLNSVCEHYVADITDFTVVSCLYRHASLGKWVYAASPQLPTENAVVRR